MNVTPNPIILHETLRLLSPNSAQIFLLYIFILVRYAILIPSCLPLSEGYAWGSGESFLWLYKFHFMSISFVSQIPVYVELKSFMYYQCGKFKYYLWFLNIRSTFYFSWFSSICNSCENILFAWFSFIQQTSLSISYVQAIVLKIKEVRLVG